MSREESFRDEVDRQDFLKTLAGTCQKTGFEVHAYWLMLERMEGELGEGPAGDLRRESAEVRAERIIADKRRRQRWREADLAQRRKGDAAKPGWAARLKRERTLTVGWIAARL